MKKYTTLFILILGFIFQLNSQNIITDRPDQTEASSVIPLNSFQLETGFLVQDYKSDDRDTRGIALPNVLLRISLTEWMELRLVNQFEFNYVLTEYINVRTSGFSDLQLGTKIQIFRKEESRTEVAFLAHGIIPSSFLEEGSDVNFGLISRFLISHKLTDKLGLGYNIGYDQLGDGDGNLTYTMSLSLGLNDKIACFFEGYGEYAEFEEFGLNFDAGVTYLVLPNIQLDYSFGLGLTENMNFISAGLSWNFQ